jgi:DUF1365 family protein
MPIQKWEYLVQYVDLDDSDAMGERLNKLGTERWELVSVVRLERDDQGEGELGGHAFMKRPKE